jgi:diacylglycerol kinase family enzyme
MRKIVLINSRSGRARRGHETQKLLDILANIPEVEPQILGKHDDPTLYARWLVQEGAEVVGVAGGDGTVSAVANGLAGTQTALAVIPFGTLNHFAKDLGIPPQLDKAARLLLAGEASEKYIDVGKVNQRIFINNSSVGLYPRLVRFREKHEGKFGKIMAYCFAAGETLRYPISIRVKISLEDEVKERTERVWLVFASNNHISLRLPRPGYRERLDEGCLNMYVLRASNKRDLFKTVWDFLRRKLAESQLVEEQNLTNFEVITWRHNRVSVACDGEVFRMSAPLQYKILPAALKVRLPIPPDKAQ